MTTIQHTYYWYTDAASGHLQAASMTDALRRLIDEREWAEIDSPREARYIADGAYLCVRDEDTRERFTRGAVG